jgi:hypothetical protein
MVVLLCEGFAFPTPPLTEAECVEQAETILTDRP